MLDAIVALDTRWVLTTLLLAIDAWSIGLIILARAARRETLLWIAVVLLVPVFGCIFWYALGPKPPPRSR
ncbi:MAG: PLDc N-terminal domain-containing protein [Gemmatimonadota bacterium]